MTLSRHFESLYINNEWVRSASNDTVDIINPATEEVVGSAPVGALQDADAAITAARRAFDTGPWPKLTPKERAAILQRFHDALMSRRTEIVDLIVAEAGALTGLADNLHFGMIMDCFQFYIDHIQKRDFIKPVSVKLNPNWAGGKTLTSYVRVEEPIGVVAAITAYNFPYFLNISKIAHALSAGCTMVLKPSPFTPLQALAIAEIAQEAGLPEGVLNVINGGVDVGELLTTDTRVDQISFTGSDKVGALIKAQAAPTLKRVALELGGKSALIVCDDADVQAAAVTGFGHITTQSGQGCAALTRHIVHNSVRDQYLDVIRGLASQVKLGNPADPSVTMGPLINAAQRQRVLGYIQQGLDEGGKIVTGGHVPSHLDKGFFVEPTFISDVDNRHVIAQQEIFGPVAAVIGFDTEEEAIALANDSDFGLNGSVFSTDTGRAFEIAMQVRTGGININGGGGRLNPEVPFGGFKRSSIGREYSSEGLDEYLETKVVEFKAG